MKIDRNWLKDRIKYIVRGMAIVALAVILVIILTSCGKKNDIHEVTNPTEVISTPDVTAVPTATAEPTEAPTEVPTLEPTATPEPTPDPTATPLPDDWVTDPRGIIPTDVHIYAQDKGTGAYAYCITINEDGDTVCQCWSMVDGFVAEIVVPEAFLDGIAYIQASMTGDEKGVSGYRSDGSDKLFFYQINGHSFCFDVTSGFMSPTEYILTTKDGKLIWYQRRSTSYKCHDFGAGNNVIIDDNYYIIVNGEYIDEGVEDLDYSVISF